jgi:hypothetical protein
MPRAAGHTAAAAPTPRARGHGGPASVHTGGCSRERCSEWGPTRRRPGTCWPPSRPLRPSTQPQLQAARAAHPEPAVGGCGGVRLPRSGSTGLGSVPDLSPLLTCSSQSAAHGWQRGRRVGGKLGSCSRTSLTRQGGVVLQAPHGPSAARVMLDAIDKRSRTGAAASAGGG